MSTPDRIRDRLKIWNVSFVVIGAILTGAGYGISTTPYQDSYTTVHASATSYQHYREHYNINWLPNTSTVRAYEKDHYPTEFWVSRIIEYSGLTLLVLGVPSILFRRKRS